MKNLTSEQKEVNKQKRIASSKAVTTIKSIEKGVKSMKSTKKSNVAAKKVKSVNAVKSAKVVKSVKSGKSEKAVKTVKSSVKKADTQKAVKTVKVAKKKIVKPVRAMKQIRTNSVNGKMQQRTIGTRKEKNQWGHFEGTIGAKIDNLIKNENFTKKQIEVYAGTKMSKVNSHINHLRKEKGFDVKIDAITKIVKFA